MFVLKNLYHKKLTFLSFYYYNVNSLLKQPQSGFRSIHAFL